jgi:hypothetical protein
VEHFAVLDFFRAIQILRAAETTRMSSNSYFRNGRRSMELPEDRASSKLRTSHQFAPAHHSLS